MNSQKKTAILRHFLDHLQEIVRYETLKDLVGNADPVALVHILQRREGWGISSGQVILDMIEAGEFPVDDPDFPDISTIRPQDFMLMDEKPDPDAPSRWKLAERMRRE